MNLCQAPRFCILVERYRIIWIHVVTTEQIGGKFGDESVGVYTSGEGAFTLVAFRGPAIVLTRLFYRSEAASRCLPYGTCPSWLTLLCYPMIGTIGVLL
jgi:hypothetical protein